jgi:hypothetical protein
MTGHWTRRFVAPLIGEDLSLISRQPMTGQLSETAIENQLTGFSLSGGFVASRDDRRLDPADGGSCSHKASSQHNLQRFSLSGGRQTSRINRIANLKIVSQSPAYDRKEVGVVVAAFGHALSRLLQRCIAHERQRGADREGHVVTLFPAIGAGELPRLIDGEVERPVTVADGPTLAGEAERNGGCGTRARLRCICGRNVKVTGQNPGRSDQSAQPSVHRADARNPARETLN